MKRIYEQQLYLPGSASSYIRPGYWACFAILCKLNRGTPCAHMTFLSKQITAHTVYEHSDQQKEWLKELETGVQKTHVYGLDNPYM